MDITGSVVNFTIYVQSTIICKKNCVHLSILVQKSCVSIILIFFLDFVLYKKKL